MIKGEGGEVNNLSKRTLSRPILILGAVQLIESLAFALPISFFPNYVITLGARAERRTRGYERYVQK